LGKQFLVQCIPQRGFNERRRSGILFTAEGTIIQRNELTREILEDPGLRVMELPAGAKIVRAGEVNFASTQDGEQPAGKQHGPGAEGEPGEKRIPAGDEEEPGRCVFIKTDGERCKGRAREGELLCGTHRDKLPAGADVTQVDSPAGGAVVTQLV
jgi:hypothetical protein